MGNESSSSIPAANGLPTVDIQALDSEGRVPAWIFHHQALHEIELDSIFGSAWAFIGHESELPSPGDYALRYIGNDPFIFVRDEHGEIRVLLDLCRHRGTRLCRAEKGNAAHFRCPYHGWTYRNTGELIGLPLARQAFKQFDKASWGLVSAAQVDSIHGLVFATLDADAPSLAEYLGPMAWYLDIFFGLDSGGAKVIGEPHRWVVNCNWKLPADNFSGDDYHTLTLHKSIWELEGLRKVGTQGHMNGYHIDAGNGHSVTLSMPGLDADPGGLEFWGYPKDLVERFDFGTMNKEQIEIARRTRTMGGTVFPNLSFLSTALTVDPGKEPVPFMTVRLWQPREAGKTEIWSWLFAWNCATEEEQRRAYEVGMGTFSAGGIFEQDDSEPWQTITEVSGTRAVAKLGIDYNYSMGLPGKGTAEPVSDWPGPGTAKSPRLDESGQRAFYRRWHEFVYGTNGA